VVGFEGCWTFVLRQFEAYEAAQARREARDMCLIIRVTHHVVLTAMMRIHKIDETRAVHCVAASFVWMKKGKGSS
jgi:hypothetical protein